MDSIHHTFHHEVSHHVDQGFDCDVSSYGSSENEEGLFNSINPSQSLD
jgi:hypothetical protein